jgi:hypothetical protein
MARFCEFCGTKNEDGSAFCCGCGKELSKPEQTHEPEPRQQIQQQAYAAPVQQTPAYTEPARREPSYYAPGQPPRKKSNTGLIIGIAAAVLVVAAIVIVLFVIHPFGSGNSGSEALIDPETVFAEVGDSYMDLLPEKPAPIVPAGPLPTAAPAEPLPDPASGTYRCDYLAFSLEPAAGWYADESLLNSDSMVTFSKDENAIFSVLYTSGTTTDYFEWDYQSFVDDYSVSAGGTGGEVTDKNWTTTLQGYDTYYLFYTTYNGSSAMLYNYTFVINDGSGNCYLLTLAQSAETATEQEIDEAFAMIDSFKLA